MSKPDTENVVLIQITDLHIFTNTDDEFGGVNTARSLQEVLQLIKHRHPHYDLMLATGDLVQIPEISAYDNVLEQLRTVNGPVYCIPGNHDDPDMMLRMFNTGNIHFIPKVVADNWKIVFLNSYKPATHSGFLPANELKALHRELADDHVSHVLICLHHHPVSIGSDWMDSMMLENSEDLFATMDQHDHIRGMIWGHIHQEFSAIRNNVLLLGTPSTCAQFLPEAKQYGVDEKQPGYRWLILRNDGSIDTGIERLPG